MSGKKMQNREAQRKGAPPQQQQRKKRKTASPPLSQPTRAPAASARKAVLRPAMIKQGPKSIRVIHREFIGNVTGSIAFATSRRFELNPGLPDTFPWLSGLANNWDEYRFNKLAFHYLTRTGSATAGSVIMSPDYDSSDGTPISEQVLTTFAQTVEDAPWKDIQCHLDPPALRGGMTRKFIRSLPLLANQDVKTYDCGNMFIATVDFAAATPCGKLWVEYDVEFYVPSLHSTGNTLGGSFSSIVGGDQNSSKPLGSNPSALGTTQGVQVGVDAATGRNNLTFQSAGDYLVSMASQGSGYTTSGTSTSPSISSGPGTLQNYSSGINGGTNYTGKWDVKNVLAGTQMLLPLLNGGTTAQSVLEVVRALSGSLVL